MFTCTKLSKGESLLSFHYSNNFYSCWWDSACATEGLQAHPVRRDNFWSHRRVTLHQDKEDSIYLFKPNIASQTFPFPSHLFLAFFFYPLSSHYAYVPATLWHEQSHGLPVQQFQNDAVVSLRALISKSVCREKGVPLKGVKDAPHQKQAQGWVLLSWLVAQGAAGRCMHRGHFYPHLPWFDLLLFSSVSFLHAPCCRPHCSPQNQPQMIPE